VSDALLATVLQQLHKLSAARPPEGETDRDLLRRFATAQDRQAFEALVRRHGPLVLSVCRRVLRHEQDAEDAFQATFLVLARKAGSIRDGAAIVSWLYGVAYRTARDAKRAAGRRRAHEARAQAVPPPDPSWQAAWREVQSVLDDEIGQLPDRLRAPFLLCHLEGHSRAEAARQLGLTEGTVWSRLAQARKMLRGRLARRGITLSAVLGAAGITGRTEAVALPVALLTSTARAAAALARGSATGVSAQVAALAERGVRALVLTRLKLGLALALTAGLLVAGAGVLARPEAKPAPADEPPPAAPAADAGRGKPADDPLPAQGPVRLGTARYRHGSRITSLAVSADGTRAATTSGWAAPESARMFDLTDGQCLYTLPRSPGTETEAVALSPDGKTLATRQDKTVYLWDAATGKERGRIELPGAPSARTITGWLAFTPSGRHLAVTPSGKVVSLIDVETQDVAGTFPHDEPVFACAFSPDGKWMATGGGDQEKGIHFARLWDVTAQKELRRFRAGDGHIGALAFSADGATLAGGGGDARLHLWDVATGKEQRTYPRIGRAIRSVAFAPDGKAVAAAGDSVQVYDTSTGKEHLRIDRRAHGLQFSGDGKVLAGAVSGAIYRWEAATGRLLTPSAAQDSAVAQILVTPDGRRVFTCDQEGDLHVWDSAAGRYVRRIPAAAERGVRLTPDGRFLAWAIEDDTVRTPDPSQSGWLYSGSRLQLYDVAAERVLDRFPAVKDEASVEAVLPDGKTILTLDRRTATVRLWDIDSGKERRSFPVAEGAEALPCVAARAVLSPDGKTLAVGYDRADNISILYRAVPVRLWDVGSGKPGPRLDGHMNSVNGLAFSPDGRLLVTWAESPWGTSMIDRVFVWDTATGLAVPNLDSGLSIGAGSAAFAPDGRTLATASVDGLVRVWEVATWEVRAEFRGHRDLVTALAFGPRPFGCPRLFSGGLDTTVLAYDVRPPQGEDTLADAWQALADAGAKAGFRAQGRFLAEPARAVEWFKLRLKPAGRPDPSRVKALIADLDNDNFATRERATAELKDHWPAAAAAVREVVAKSPSAEARRRAEGLLREMEEGVTPRHELRAVRAVEVLEWVATPEARALLLTLAKGAPDARLTREAAAACKRLEGRK
jgi:RNA polymerase sigma factor (sigma-70 family)